MLAKYRAQKTQPPDLTPILPRAEIEAAELRYPSRLEMDTFKLWSGWCRVFLEQDFPGVVVVGLGKKGAGVDDQENWHEGKENIRVAVAG